MKELIHSRKLIFLTMALVLVLSIALLSFSCGKGTTTTPATTTKPAATTVATTTPTVTPKTGGTLKIYLPTEPFSLYPPAMTGQTDGQTSSITCETLFRLDEKGIVVPLLATGYNTDPTAKTFTITLRKGIKFTDGSDFNSAIVKWNMQQYQAGNKAELKNVTSIDTPDDYTVVLHLGTFDNTLIINLSNAADAGRMISKQSFDANGGKTWADKNPVGTGPFKFVSWTKDVNIVFARNDAYWGGKPYMDGVQFSRVADITTAQMNFTSGGLDIFWPDPVNAKPLIATGLYNLAITPEGQFPGLAGYSANSTSPFAKLEVRQAMAYAVNSQAISDAVGYGYWKVSNQWAIPGTWGYNPNVVGYPYNPTKAKQLLTTAGYPTGFSTTLNFYNTSPAVVDVCTAVQKMLNDVGITTTLNPLQRPAYADMASNAKGWTGIVRQQGFSSVDPLVKYANVAAGVEYAGMYLPQEFVDTHKQAIAAPDQATKQKLTQQLMALAVDKYCMANYFWVEGQTVLKNKRIMDDGYAVQPYRYLNPMTWLSDGK